MFLSSEEGWLSVLLVVKAKIFLGSAEGLCSCPYVLGTMPRLYDRSFTAHVNAKTDVYDINFAVRVSSCKL